MILIQYLQVKAETDMYLRQLEMEGRVEEVSEELLSWLSCAYGGELSIDLNIS